MTHTIEQTSGVRMNDTVADTVADLAKTKDDLVNEFRTLISEGEELMRQTQNLSGDALSLARERFRSRLADARSKMYDLSDVARVRGREAVRVADDYVRDSPWVAVGAAAGAGFLIGVLLARR